MIACISPSAHDIKETSNTLRYADCVKSMEKPEMPKQFVVSRLKMLPPTPAKFSRKRELNHTIETPTPTKGPYLNNVYIGLGISDPSLYPFHCQLHTTDTTSAPPICFFGTPLTPLQLTVQTSYKYESPLRSVPSWEVAEAAK